MLEANFNIVQYIYLCQLLLIERLVRVPTMYSKIGEILQKTHTHRHSLKQSDTKTVSIAA